MLAGAEKHGTKGSAKIGHVPDVTIIYKHGRAVGLHVQFQFGSVRAGMQRPTVRRHPKTQNMHAPRFHNKGFRETVIARLSYRNLVLTRQEHDLLVAL